MAGALPAGAVLSLGEGSENTLQDPRLPLEACH